MSTNKFGSFDWVQSTQGHLSIKDKIYLINQTLLPTIISLVNNQIKRYISSQRALNTITLEQIHVPDTLMIKKSITELNNKGSQAMINHSWRTYFWSSVLGIVHEMSFDPELLLTASLLHGIGLTDTHLHNKGCQCFALASTENFENLATTVDYPEDKVKIIKDAICMQINGYSELDNPIEVTLLQYGISCDIIGERLFDIPSSFCDELLATYPRENLNKACQYLIKQEAALVKKSRTAFLGLLGLPIMIKLNPFKE
ncbi:phosphohydrolase [Psychrobacter sp. I-STPA10]|uniref:phosphohydrolase n=1 Tax=Psychrobacter sp. I-STPA10 TaxID=2585769 RepID=UPI001E54BA42|nr:phosphohydrolase [Psychrobacter sp. I-STPA10]